LNDLTRILRSITAGERQASTDLLPLVYEELRKLAASKMAREAPGQTLQPTALVHEAWLRLTAHEGAQWEGRAHFFGAAAEVMRRILIDSARRKQAERHGGARQRVDILNIDLAAPAPDDQLLALDEALERFASLNKPKSELVKLRYYAGLTIEEAASTLGISVATAKRWWIFARAWLFDHMRSQSQSTTRCEPDRDADQF
jgi:RNA polymerase sigma factor (TIGR02999 family)